MVNERRCPGELATNCLGPTRVCGVGQALQRSDQRLELGRRHLEGGAVLIARVGCFEQLVRAPHQDLPLLEASSALLQLQAQLLGLRAGLVLGREGPFVRPAGLVEVRDDLVLRGG